MPPSLIEVLDPDLIVIVAIKNSPRKIYL
ncbi:hypothetical protein S40288_11806 [Stachybotrys chartarum IBT 40288]|nr:hypothetical protein S40288_11806 [Stachybotrys chartarum IBT 40288]